MDKVLIAYASKYGSTKEVAEKIAEKLKSSGIVTEILPVKQIGSISDYKAVILGSAAYMGQWRKEAVKFIKKNIDTLSEKKAWIFTTGPTGKGDPGELLDGWIIPKNIREIVDAIQPEDVIVFHGKLDSEKLSGFERWILKKVKAPTGDFRDWNMIEAWAENIAKNLTN